MTIERFITLFFCYMFSVLMTLLAVKTFKWQSFSAKLIGMSVIGFIALSIPLVILTLMK
ncbi:hypothetical protein [Vagococcus xieshaowenii]|uniref:hypothetical protein n=1 Tax=Vagococcus xieshaowenii TaxID=2562451 RepID=UPI0014324689|nr:hypothetical protein [Vagococcus xieshaowenii]